MTRLQMEISKILQYIHVNNIQTLLSTKMQPWRMAELCLGGRHMKWPAFYTAQALLMGWTCQADRLGTKPYGFNVSLGSETSCARGCVTQTKS